MMKKNSSKKKAASQKMDGLTPAQKKLPPALQRAIAARKKKRGMKK
jgi:hypothetical protein